MLVIASSIILLQSKYSWAFKNVSAHESQCGIMKYLSQITIIYHIILGIIYHLVFLVMGCYGPMNCKYNYKTAPGFMTLDPKSFATIAASEGGARN